MYHPQGKWPVLKPTSDQMTWSARSWINTSIVIDAWDPAFEGGNNCGENSNELCTYYIGVYGRCHYSTSANDTVSFSINATLKPHHKIFNVPQYNQHVAAKEMVQYGFCVENQHDVKLPQHFIPEPGTI